MTKYRFELLTDPDHVIWVEAETEVKALQVFVGLFGYCLDKYNYKQVETPQKQSK